MSKTYQNILSENGSTKFTEVVNGTVTLKSTRPGIIVSSTSWTEDEDFSVLFEALQGIKTNYFLKCHIFIIWYCFI